jgi:HK97 gp10 family phage protein
MPAKLKSRIPTVIAELTPRVDAAARAGAELVEQSAKARAPDRPPIGEGLVEAIHTEKDRIGSYCVVAGGGPDEVFWGHMQEFGTTRHGPQPFLVPALEEQRERVVGLVARSLRGL